MSTAARDIYAMVFIGVLVLAVMVLFIVSFVIRYPQKQKAYLMDKQKMTIEFEKQMLLTLLEMKEQTFKVISEEIHDNIGQVLSLAKLNLALAIEAHPQITRITESHELLSRSIQDLRDLAHSLDTDYVSRQGIGNCLAYELERISRTGIYKTEIVFEGIPFIVNKQKELVLFRIAQEAIANILRHADATFIKLSTRYFSPGIEIVISDNGKGMLTENLAPGSGLTNMQNRARLIGAAWELESKYGSGTTIMVTLPNAL